MKFSLMKQFMLYLLLFGLPVIVQAADMKHIQYFGQTIEVKIRHNYPVSLRFEEAVQQVRWDPESANFKYQPTLKQGQKINTITFFSTKNNPASTGLRIIVGNTPDKLEDYSIVLSGSADPVPSTIYLHNQKSPKSRSTAKVKDLMRVQDNEIYRMLFAHRFNYQVDNYYVKDIQKPIKKVGYREIFLESAILGNVRLRVNSGQTEEVGLYSAKLMFCNRSVNKKDLISTGTIIDMFPDWEKISYDYDEIPPGKCMPVYVLTKRDPFYDSYID
ncbi:MAG: hypothetical protein ACE5FU_01280 [Nitrospinota bacterium]